MSMLPTQEQLKEKIAVNLMAERNTWMLFYHLNVEREMKYVILPPPSPPFFSPSPNINSSLPETTYSPSQVQVLETAMLADTTLKKNMVRYITRYSSILTACVVRNQFSARKLRRPVRVDVAMHWLRIGLAVRRLRELISYYASCEN